MNQLEIEYFFPLTQQIPLELDYTQSDKPKLTYYSLSGGTSTISPSQFAFYPTTQTWTTTTINIDQTDITITSKTKQPLYRRVLYKLLGINWKQT